MSVRDIPMVSFWEPLHVLQFFAVYYILVLKILCRLTN